MIIFFEKNIIKKDMVNSNYFNNSMIINICNFIFICHL